MPDGLVFYLAVLFSEQFAFLLFPVEWDAFAQPQDGQRRRDVTRHDAMHDPGREHREAQRPLDAGAVDAQHVRQLLAVGVAPLVDCPLP